MARERRHISRDGISIITATSNNVVAINAKVITICKA